MFDHLELRHNPQSGTAELHLSKVRVDIFLHPRLQTLSLECPSPTEELTPSQFGVAELRPSQPRAAELPTSQPGTAEFPTFHPAAAELPQSQFGCGSSLRPSVEPQSFFRLSMEPPNSLHSFGATELPPSRPELLISLRPSHPRAAKLHRPGL